MFKKIISVFVIGTLTTSLMTVASSKAFQPGASASARNLTDASKIISKAALPSAVLAAKAKATTTTTTTVAKNSSVNTGLTSYDFGYKPEKQISMYPFYASPKGAYGTPPDAVQYVEPNETLTVCINNTSNVNIFRLDKNYKVTRKLTIKKVFPLFCGFTGDGNGNYYILFGKANKEADKSKNLALRRYDYNGKLTGSCDTGGSEYDVMVPLTSSTSRLTYVGGKIGIHMGRLYYKSSDGLNHQGGVFIVVDTSVMKTTDASIYQTAGHSFDQRTLFYNEDFLTLDLADNYPRGFSLQKDKISKVIFTYKTYMPNEKSPYRNLPAGKWSNDNNTYSDLGGVAADPRGYVVLGASEKTLDFKNSKKDTRNLFMLLVDKDFHKIARDGETNEVSKKVVISKGEDSPRFSFYTFDGDLEKQKRTGVVWLTNYTDAAKNCVTAPKLVPMGYGNYAALWEDHGQKYNSTYYLVFNSNGQIIKKVTSIGKTRLSPGDDAVYINGHVVWISSTDKGKRLYRLKIDVDKTQLTTDITSATNNVIKGTLRLPAGRVAPKGGINLYVNAISDNGTEDLQTDDIRKYTYVSIREGLGSAEYAFEVPPNVGYKIDYEIINASQFQYNPKGYYCGTATKASSTEQVIVNATNGAQVNIDINEVTKFSGSISLPKGRIAPKGGIPMKLLAAGYNPTGEESSEAMDFSINVFIPEGISSIAYSFTVPKADTFYSLKYEIRGKLSHYLAYGYYSEKGTVFDELQKSFLTNTDSDKVNINLLEGYDLKINLALPNGELASKDGLRLLFDFFPDNGTPEITYDDLPQQVSAFIEEGKNSCSYTLSVPANNWGYRIAYTLFKMTDRYESGFYSINGITPYLEEATPIIMTKDMSLNLTIKSK